MKRLRLGLVGILAGGAVACVPARAWDIPALRGRVLHGGDPVVGATVKWVNLSWHDGQAEVPTALAVTDETGKFVMNAHRRWTVGMLLPADAVVEWRIDLESGGKSTVLWHQRLVTPGLRSTPGRLEVDCDTTEQEPCMLVDSDSSRLKSGVRLPVGESGRRRTRG